jgi:hypothetical protein
MFGDLFSQHADYQKGILYQGRRRFLVAKGNNSLEPPSQFKTRRQSLRSIQNAQTAAAKLQPIEIAPQHLASVIMNTKNSFLNLRNNNDFRSKRNIKSGTNKPLVIQHFSSTDAKDWDEQVQAGCHIYVNKRTGEVSEECPWKATVHFAVKQAQQSAKLESPPPKPQITSPSARNVKLEPLTHSPSRPLPSASNTMQSSPGATLGATTMGTPVAGTTGIANVFVSSGSSVKSLGSLGISSGRYQVYDEDDDLGTGSLVYDHNELEDMLQLLDTTKIRS